MASSPVLGRADDADEVVKVVERDLVALEDVRAILGLAEAELRAAGDDIAAVLDVALDEFLDVHLLRPLLVEGQQDDAEGGFEGGLLEELVDDDLGLLAALEFDDDAGVLVGLVAQVADAVDLLVGHQLGNARDQGRAVDVVGDLGDDDLLSAALEFLSMGLAAHADDAFSRREIGNDALAAGDDAARGKIGSRDHVHDLVDRDAGAVDDGADRGDQFVEVVWRDVGRHADRDAGRAVHQEPGQCGGQDGGLGRLLVVIGGEINGVLVEVAKQLFGRFGRAGTRCSGRRPAGRHRQSRNCPGD